MRMMLQKLATHIWPKDQPGLRFRVVVAMSLLIGAKVLLLVILWCLFFYELIEGLLIAIIPQLWQLTLLCICLLPVV